MGWPKGKKQTPEHIAGSRTPEANAKRAASLTGKKQTPEHIAKRLTPEANAKRAVTMTGYKQTPEHTAKIVDANTGRIFSDEHCSHLSAALTGRTFSSEHIANLSISINSPEVKFKISGPNSPHWMGGISKLPYAFEFNDKLKEEVRRRDNYKCQLCDTPQAECKKRLSVHHIDYDKKNSDPVNLIALCISCNSKVNKNRKHWTKYFQTMVISRSITNLSN